MPLPTRPQRYCDPATLVSPSLKRDMIRVEGEKNLLRQDFDIYKRHANYLLMKERELNARIRTVLDCTKCTGKDTS